MSDGAAVNGSFMAQWVATLKSDCPTCPWWNDSRPIKHGRDYLDVLLPAQLGGQGQHVPELFWDEGVPVVSAECCSA